MNVTLWGTRGSLGTPGPEAVRYGGNTSCVELRGEDGTLLVLDAGTGVRRLGNTIEPDIKRVDILLTHLHMDHILGLGFFQPLLQPDLEVHIWGPSSTTLGLRARLTRYLSPPLFPVSLRDLPCRLTLHDVVQVGRFEIGPFAIRANLVCHPGPTVGFRITEKNTSIAYIPDHEPALVSPSDPTDPAWISGFELAEGVDLLIHDAQYTEEEYLDHIGWGHSALPDVLRFAATARVKKLILFHHDPGHTDAVLDQIYEDLDPNLPFEVESAIEGTSFKL